MNRNIISTILIIIGIGIYFTVTRSMYADAQSVKVKNDQLVIALSNAEEIIKTRDEITKQYIALPEKDKIYLDKMIPSSVDNIRLVIDINSLARQKNLAISDVKAILASNSTKTPGAPSMSAPTISSSGGSFQPITPGVASNNLSYNQYVAEPVLDKVNLSFKAVSTYEQMLDFLRTLERNLRIMDLTHLSLKTSDSGLYEFDVQLQTYWLRQ